MFGVDRAGEVFVQPGSVRGMVTAKRGTVSTSCGICAVPGEALRSIRSSPQFRMQFGHQTNSQRPENRGISTIRFQSLKEWWGNCMRNWGGSGVFRGFAASSKLVVIEAGRPQAAGTTQNNPLKINGPKKPDPSRPSSKLLAVIKAVGRHGDEERSRLEVSIWDFGSRNFARRAPRY